MKDGLGTIRTGIQGQGGGKTDAVLIAIRAVGRDLAELVMKPALDATARFAMVTLAGRSEAPVLSIVRRVMKQLLLPEA